MKKTAIIVLLLVATLTAAAQGDGSQYSVRYVKEHLLYEQGDEVNVIDVDMEWPEVVDGADMRPLQTFIVKHLLGGNGFDFDTSYASFRSAFGQPVTKQFQSTPDDKKTCYVDIKLKMVAHKAGRFVSYALEGYTEPAAQSLHKESQVSMLVTYDLIGLTVLLRDDILLAKRMKNQFHELELLLPVALSNDYVANLSVNDACLTEKQVMLFNNVVDMVGVSSSYVLQLKPNLLSRFLSKEAKSLLKSTKAKISTVNFKEQQEIDGEAICLKPDTQPQFQIAGRTLNDYLSEGLGEVDSEIDGERRGQVLAQLIVDKEGLTREVRVTKPLAPAYDREVVRVVKGLPRWKPATKDGQNVATKVNVLLVF